MTDCLIELSATNLQTNFERADDYLKQVFSKYTHPGDMEGCPCCVDECKRDSLRKGNLQPYLWHAMTSWGTEYDFKHYIPQLFSFVFFEKFPPISISFLENKLNYVQNWTPEEIQAIGSWLSSYAQSKYVSLLKDLIKKSRLNALNWVEDANQELSCDFPFSVFLEYEFDETIPLLPPAELEKFAHLLDIWPNDEIDFVAYAHCLTDYQVFSQGEYGIFKGKAANWLNKNETMLEAFFWKTEDARLQQLFSDALLCSPKVESC